MFAPWFKLPKKKASPRDNFAGASSSGQPAVWRGKRACRRCSPLFQLGALLQLCLALAGCATVPDSTPSARQQAEADLVLYFQSWNSISFIKPDVMGTVGVPTVRQKTFTRAAIEKLLRNLKIGRDFAVVVLDRRYYPDPAVANGGMDEIQKFLEDQNFKRVAFQDGSARDSTNGLPIVRDTGAATPK